MWSVSELFQHGVLRDQVLRPFIVERRNDEARNPRLFDTSIREKAFPGTSDWLCPPPVDCEPREFIIHLFSQLCGPVPHGPSGLSAIAAETRRHLEQFGYLRT